MKRPIWQNALRPIWLIIKELCCRIGPHDGALPLFEKSPEAKGNQFQHSLNHKNQREDIITVLQTFIQILRNTDTITDSQTPRILNMNLTEM